MYSKILAQLRAKFPGTQVKLLERVAKVLAKTVTEEDQVQTAVDEAGELVTEMADFVQKEGDRRASEAIKKHTESKGNEDDEDEEEGAAGQKSPSKKKNSDVPEWAKTLLETSRILNERIAAFEAQNAAKAQSERLTGIFTEKKIPASFYKHAIAGRTFKDEDELNAFAATIESSWAEHQQELADRGLSNVTPPVLGGTNKEGVSAAVADFIASKSSDKASDLGGKKL